MISYSQRAIRRDADSHEKQPALLDALDDRDQSGLETAAHGLECIEPRSTTETLQTPWPKRLEELVRRTGTSSTSSLDEESAQSMHHHLDALERILGDLPQEPMHEIPEESIPTAPDQSDHGGINKEEILSQLQGLMSEVTTLNEEGNKRRKESYEIRDLFEERCRGLTRTVAELEDEVLELQGDLVEDSIELEGIQGTVRGLQDWIDRLRETQKMSRLARDRSQQEARRRWAIRRTSLDVGTETDAEIVLDGLTAWMRGWRDVEEGFQVRSRARQMRREKRQEQHLRPREKLQEMSRRSWAG
ncbi:hypothetical protein N7509_006785 [Penicillium cosmopolitanum]|uniref:Uncharacterized protein n=1 Tax=Penicillium cosmopolitanum TaxID=1131564 RepID=A0A9X0B7P3_9EURO|nr:uncharacterized protein N7509_006785 [Penicillium cosmopolitanum]KAJ5391295.1 hypothetical protein N7509_006785 [Penicillium cosmopolitanum]